MKPRASNASTRTPEKAAAFCAALAESCNVGKACKALKIGRTTAFEWKRDDPDFAKMWDAAMQVGISALEDEAHRRAFDGTDKPVYHAGSQCGTVQEYSDTLAIFLLKAHAPAKYRESIQAPGAVEMQAAVAALLKQLAGGLQP